MVNSSKTQATGKISFVARRSGDPRDGTALSLVARQAGQPIDGTVQRLVKRQFGGSLNNDAVRHSVWRILRPVKTPTSTDWYEVT